LQPNHRFFGKSYYPSDEELGGRGAKNRSNNDAEYDEFLRDFQSISRKPNTPKKMEFQKGNLNLEMIVKLRRIETISKIIARKKSLI